MSNDEKRILKALVESGTALMSPAEFINGVAGHNRRLVENLIVKGYIEEVPQEVPGLRLGNYKTINFYRATHKGLMAFNPWYEKAWFAVRGDVRTIIVSAITALVTSLVIYFAQKL